MPITRPCGCNRHVRRCRQALMTGAIMSDASLAAEAARPAATFNDTILKAVRMIAGERAGKGYDLNSYFTQNLTYGPDHPGAIRANHPPLTMCVAAVTEVMI